MPTRSVSYLRLGVMVVPLAVVMAACGQDKDVRTGQPPAPPPEVLAQRPPEPAPGAAPRAPGAPAAAARPRPAAPAEEAPPVKLAVAFDRSRSDPFMPAVRPPAEPSAVRPAIAAPAPAPGQVIAAPGVPPRPGAPSVPARPPRPRGGDTPLEKVELARLKVTGVLWRSEPPRALVEDPEGKGFIVVRGTAIGMDRGRVTQILPTGIRVLEEEVDQAGNVKPREVTLALVEHRVTAPPRGAAPAAGVRPAGPAPAGPPAPIPPAR